MCLTYDPKKDIDTHCGVVHNALVMVVGSEFFESRLSCSILVLPGSGTHLPGLTGALTLTFAYPTGCLPITFCSGMLPIERPTLLGCIFAQSYGHNGL